MTPSAPVTTTTCASPGCPVNGVVWYADAPRVHWCMKHDPRALPIERNPPDRDPRPRRRVVFTQCVWCGVDLDVHTATKDHVVPRSRGGSIGMNLAPSCQPCNSDKGDMNAAEYLAVLRGRLTTNQGDQP